MSLLPDASRGRHPRVPGRPPLRIGGYVSGVRRPRLVLVAALGLVVTLLAVALNIGYGEYPIDLVEVLAVLFGGGADAQQFVVLELRVPRSITGALVGAALAISGAITQTIARNPLASPDTLGINSGAGAAAVFLIVLGDKFGTAEVLRAALGLPVAALLGGLTTAVGIYMLSYRKGIEGYRLVLIGIGINAVLASLIAWLLVVADINDAARATVWLTGSLNGRGWEHVRPVAWALFVLLPSALLLSFVLGGLQFGDDTARALGIRVNLSRSALLIVAVALASVAVAAAGPIAFVALVAPQIALRLVRSPRPPLLASASVGAALVVAADLMARIVSGASELPVGIVTACVGAPFLLYLLAHRNRETRL